MIDRTFDFVCCLFSEENFYYPTNSPICLSITDLGRFVVRFNDGGGKKIQGERKEGGGRNFL